jgi:hypothetical protein
MRLYIGLLHYPVYNKNYQRIASAITTFDLHDLSRLARTYDARGLFVITPLEDQQRFAERVLRHWTNGYGADYNRFRKEAMELTTVSPSLEDAAGEIGRIEGETPLTIATDACRQEGRSLNFTRAREILETGEVVFLIFGTAWGLDREVVDGANYILDPIEGRTDYNHLSVRAAAAIVLDRLAGRYR